MKDTFKKIIIKLLEIEAKLVLKKYKPTIIAITGSVGKTSTKDAIYTVLSHFFFVRKSEKSFNSEFGVPLTILGCPNGWSNPVQWTENLFKGFWLIIYPHKYPKWLVLEVGAGKPGDIKGIAKWLKPDVVVITRFPDMPVHVEFFGTPGAVIEEKTHLVKALSKDGLLVINADDPKVLDLKQKSKAKVLTFGFSEESSFRASHESISYTEVNGHSVPAGISFRLGYGGNSIPVELKDSISTNHIYAALSALAIAYDKGCNMLEAVEAIKKYHTPPGRLSLIQGIKNSLIIDDTYNASPTAAEAALELLKKVEGYKRRIAVLGDMLELGKISAEAHKTIGEFASDIADIIITVGPRAKMIADGARQKGFSEKKIIELNDAVSAGEELRKIIKDRDLVLIKGSQGVRMERTVEAVMEHPEDAKEILVRQEKEWKAKK